MPGLDTLMRLQYANQGQDMQNVDRLAQTLGGIIQNRGQRGFEQQAVKFFSDGDISPERIQEFQQMYPGVSAMEIWKIAGDTAKQREAQSMKDIMKSYRSALLEGREPDEKLMQEMLTRNPNVDPGKVMQLMEAGSKFGLTMLDAREKKELAQRQAEARKTIGSLNQPVEVPEVAEYPVTDPDATMNGETSYPAYTGKTKQVLKPVDLPKAIGKIAKFLEPKDAASILIELHKAEQKGGITPETAISLVSKLDPESGDKVLAALGFSGLKTKRDKVTLYKIDGTGSAEFDPDVAKHLQDTGVWTNVKPLDKPFEVNVANEVDTILGGMFPGYYTDKATRKKALDYYATPEGSKKVQAAAAEYAKSKAAPFYTFPATDAGIVPANARTGQMGTPAKSAEGDTFKKPLPAGELGKFGDIGVMLGQIDLMEKNYKPEYVGPVAGRLGSVKEKFVELPEGQVTFYAATRDIKDALLRARSGAQINEQEYKRLTAFLPDENLPPANFQARLKRFKAEVQSIKTEKSKMFEQGGYGAPKAASGGSSGTVKYTANGKNYNIPVTEEAAFLKDNPNARKVQ